MVRYTLLALSTKIGKTCARLHLAHDNLMCEVQPQPRTGRNMELEGLVINILKGNKVLTDEHIRQAEQMSVRSGRSMLDIALSMKWIDEVQIRDLVALKFSMDVVSIKDKEIPDDLIKLIPS